jgi:hypothetical protein
MTTSPTDGTPGALNWPERVPSTTFSTLPTTLNFTIAPGITRRFVASMMFPFTLTVIFWHDVALGGENRPVAKHLTEKLLKAGHRALPVIEYPSAQV